MKKSSEYFNKKSRLIQYPEIDSEMNTSLAPFDASGIKSRLPELLTVQNDFFPCFDWTFPPPLLNKSSAPESAAELFSQTSVIPDRYSIYLHSPFCKSLCSFCYYAIIPGKGIDLADQYVDYLIKEMQMYSQRFKGQICESIYFGGGTPSYLDNKNLKKIFDSLRQNFDIADDAEITIEAAPGTLPEEKSELLHSLGVNRLSYGIQTLDEKLLSSMNRDYTVKEALTELSHALDIIGNVNVDTMYGFENEADDTLLNTLSTFKELGIPSFSIYALDTQRTETKHDLLPPKDDAYDKKIRQFAKAEELLMSWDYQPVLQNVFIDPQRASYRHQLRRWDNLPLLAMGINAQGYAPQRPYQNVGSLKSYYQLIDENKLPVASIDILNPELELCRELTSKLRFTFVSVADMKYKYGVDVSMVFEHLIESLEELGYISHQNGIIRMTPKAAYYNNIIPMLFAPDSFKQQLLGLPEEYLESFPVPYIMTQLGRAQSCAFNMESSQRHAHTDRRVLWNRRQKSMSAPANRRQSQGRRSSDNLMHWSAIS